MYSFSIYKFKNEKSVNIFVGREYGIINFLLKEGYNIEKCAFCNNYAKIKIHWKIENDLYVIDFIEYPRGKYCTSKECPGKKLNPVSKEFLKKAYNLTDEEIEVKLKQKAKKGSNTLKERGWFDDISNNPFSKQYWIKKGYSEEESQNKVNERNHFKPEYWIKKGYSYKIADKLSKSCANTISLDSFIKKYGKEYGEKRYVETKNKMSKTLQENNKINPRHKYTFTHGGKSKEASTLFATLEKFCIKHNIKSEDIFYNNENKTKKEYWIKYKTDKVHTYFYDFFIKNKGLFIEYNGTRWHPDHRKHYRLINWRDVHTKEDYHKKLKNDLNKIKLVKKQGMKILVLWSSDGFDINLNKAKNFIIEYI